ARLLDLDRPVEAPPAWAPALPAARLGEPGFRRLYGVRLAYMAGAMANGIASEDVVIAMGRAGLLGSFGAAGLVPARVEDAVRRIQEALPHGPYAFNLIHSPAEEALERGAVDLYLRHAVRTVEASAFLDLTPHIVRYRVAGLRRLPDGRVDAANRVIAKVSRREVATKFMLPAPPAMLQALVAAGHVTAEQAHLAAAVPLCDDVTAEADSAGHTDNRPLVSLLPSLIALRDEIQSRQRYPTPVRVGAAGGIGTPAAALAALAMGAAYVVTGSVNQACVEAGASPHTKALLAGAGMADVMMAPAADMFEMGVKVQVLKKGTFFPLRAQRLYELYQSHASLDDIPAADRDRLERQIFRRSLDAVWDETARYFRERDPEQLARAEGNPKRKMALLFRWYLGLSSRWSNAGEAERETDYQIWCGPAMGAFNDWVRGTSLEPAERRRVAGIAHHLMTGAAYQWRVALLRTQGIDVPPDLSAYSPDWDVRPSSAS
ncbi:MAG TPA: PfaD family polyunsaturated fatty acid/polyketide biosynthesis protein, partial [Chloroflexota bacterium]|nr:PfaD family polyunsaturated fatty acid/polyketide biosynthesis protein [Chloroflexota bacterium]